MPGQIGTAMQSYGVIFDMDGVLVDSYDAHQRSWQMLADEVGLSITSEQFADTFGRTSRDIIEILFKVTDSAAIRRYDDRKEALYREIIRGQVPAMPGARELVKDLHATGLRLAVGSSGPPENVSLVCKEMGLDLFLKTQITGADVNRGKPDPQVFLLAAEQLGLPPRRCVVIEDAPSGIEAARRAGMPCIALSGSHESEALSKADQVVKRLDEIHVELIKALIGAP
ncbi:MAG: HAD family phosphatase [Phycisphaerales bacterium]|nr:HAD family phosphatase [Phycisphaerales bacterium]